MDMHMKSESGAILLTVLIVILTISLLGTVMVALFFNVLTDSQVELYRAQALYLSEAGIAKATSMLRGQANATGPEEIQQIIPVTKLGEGYFEVYNNFSESTVVSMGTSHGIKRTIQMKYAAF